MSSKARNAEKKRENEARWLAQEQEDRERRVYFEDIVKRLEELDIDPYKLKEYLAQL